MLFLVQYVHPQGIEVDDAFITREGITEASEERAHLRLKAFYEANPATILIEGEQTRVSTFFLNFIFINLLFSLSTLFLQIAAVPWTGKEHVPKHSR